MQRRRSADCSHTAGIQTGSDLLLGSAATVAKPCAVYAAPLDRQMLAQGPQTDPNSIPDQRRLLDRCRNAGLARMDATDALIQQALRDEEAERKRAKQEKHAHGALQRRPPGDGGVTGAAATATASPPLNRLLPPLPAAIRADQERKAARKGMTLEQIEAQEGGPVKESQVRLCAVVERHRSVHHNE